MTWASRAGLYSAGLFLLPIVAGLVAVNVWLSRVTDCHYERTFREMYEGSPEYDIIFLGPSHTVHGVNIRYVEEGTGFKAYNFGLNGANPPFMHSVYKFILRPRKKRIGTVALDTMWIQFDERWLWRTIYYDAEYIDWRTLLRYAVSDEVKAPGQLQHQKDSTVRRLLENKIPLLKYHRQLANILAGEDLNASFDFAHYYRGYTPYTPGYHLGIYGKDFYRGEVCYRPAHINPQWVQVFESLIREIQSDGTKVLLYQMPEYVEGREAAIYPQIDEIYGRLSAKYGVPFLNYNTTHRSRFNYDKRNFWNWDHLSPEGSVIFSKKMAEDLNRLGLNRVE